MLTTPSFAVAFVPAPCRPVRFASSARTVPPSAITTRPPARPKREQPISPFDTLRVSSMFSLRCFSILNAEPAKDHVPRPASPPCLSLKPFAIDFSDIKPCLGVYWSTPNPILLAF